MCKVITYDLCSRTYQFFFVEPNINNEKHHGHHGGCENLKREEKTKIFYHVGREPE